MVQWVSDVFLKRIEMLKIKMFFFSGVSKKSLHCFALLPG